MMNIIHPNMIRRLYGFNWLYARDIDESVQLLRDGADAVFVRGYHVGEEGAFRIAECLSSGACACRYFSFAYRNDLNDVACGHLADMLRVNKSLVVLSIGQVNNCTNATIKAFADAVEKHDCIENLPLTVTGSRISVTSVQNKLVRVLVRNRTAREGKLKARKDVFGRVIRNGDIKGTWNRSKLMVIGQARTGKSSTIRSLLGQKFLPGALSMSTVGASLIQTNSFALTKPEQHDSVDGDITNKKKKLGKHYSKAWVADEQDVDYTTELATRLTVSELEELERVNRFSWRKKGVVRVSRKYVEPQPTDEAHDADDENNQVEQSETEQYGLLARPFMRKREAKARFNEKFFTMPRYGKNSVSFTIWDTGGQTVFYSLHHLFLTKYGIYLLCFDLRMIYRDSKEELLFLKFWLKSVILHAETAPVFLVGAFADEKFSQGDMKKVDGILQELVSKTTNNGTTIARNPEQGLLYFPIDNSSGDGIDNLRYQIETVTLEQEYVSREVSLRWIRCLDRMLAKKNKPCISMGTVRTIVKQNGITSAEELNEMLLFYHELGVLLHLTNTEILSDTIAIRPQWLVNALCKVVRDEYVNKFDMVEMENVGLLDDVQLLLADGLASRDLLEYMWRDDEVDFLLDLMRTTMLMSNWQFNDERQYLIPSILTAPAKAKVGSPTMPKPNASQSAGCMFDFSETFLPFGFFERLICLFVAHSGRQKKSREPVLSDSSGTVYVGEETTLHLEKTDEQIYVLVEPGTKAGWCLKIMRSMLHKINEDFLGSKLSWQVKFKGVRGYISYELAMNLKLKPWFNAVQSQDPVEIGPIVNPLLW